MTSLPMPTRRHAIGPCAVLGSIAAIVESQTGIVVSRIAANDSGKRLQVEQLLSAFYAEHGQSYLLSPFQQAIDSRIQVAARSTYFVARAADSQPAAVMRLTPAPFELAALSGAIGKSASAFGDHIEFSRLVSMSTHGPAAAMALMAEACSWAYQEGYGGVVAIARNTQRRYFSRFGLTSASAGPYLIPERDNGCYWLLTGGWDDVAEAAGRVLASNEAKQTGARILGEST